MSRPPFGRSALLAAAAVAGAVVYWRASERQASRREAEIDDAVTEGRNEAQRLLHHARPAEDPFDQA